ncbi:YadA C-terminal domain-containing protein [Vibrio comitans]
MKKAILATVIASVFAANAMADNGISDLHAYKTLQARGNGSKNTSGAHGKSSSADLNGLGHRAGHLVTTSGIASTVKNASGYNGYNADGSRVRISPTKVSFVAEPTAHAVGTPSLAPEPTAVPQATPALNSVAPVLRPTMTTQATPTLKPVVAVEPSLTPQVEPVARPVQIAPPSNPVVLTGTSKAPSTLVYHSKVGAEVGHGVTNTPTPKLTGYGTAPVPAPAMTPSVEQKTPFITPNVTVNPEPQKIVSGYAQGTAIGSLSPVTTEGFSGTSVPQPNLVPEVAKTPTMAPVPTPVPQPELVPEMAKTPTMAPVPTPVAQQSSDITELNRKTAYLNDRTRQNRASIAETTAHTQENRALVNHNSDGINANHTMITHNETSIRANQAHITDNSHRIADNEAGIASNKAEIKGLREDLEHQAKVMDGAMAQGIATSSLVMPYNVGKISTTVALGHSGEANAIAGGVGVRFTENFTARSNIAYDTGSENVSIGAGVGYEW